jgi:hypothetical protein
MPKLVDADRIWEELVAVGDAHMPLGVEIRHGDTDDSDGRGAEIETVLTPDIDRWNLGAWTSGRLLDYGA